jgi:hypothetical protein
MASTRTINLIIIKLPQPRPLAHLALRAAIARLTAIRAMFTMVAQVARSVAASARHG